ncbi:cyclin-dependent kinase 11A-like [Spodoptera frugiperda]|uniref:Cyclin-dependent kinase 11A-like n=1 Tax=Spodoptera frugiperda TaxID=7108 RepID=A0A9R0DGE5_SPOFR|nr:cyclin-dependent kinase 11A-like [Spodoptera frugiperda]
MADFRMAREYEFPRQQDTPGMREVINRVDEETNGIVYRASDKHTRDVDTLFPGTSEINQLQIMYEVLGTPSDTVWPGYSALPLASEIIFDEYPSGGLRKKINQDLLSDDPSRRVTATEALLHPYFNEEPAAIEPAMFMSSLWLEDSGSDTEDHEQYYGSDMEDHGKYYGSDTEDHGKYYGSDTWYDQSYYSTNSEEDLTSDANSSVGSILNTDDDTTE